MKFYKIFVIVGYVLLFSCNPPENRIVNDNYVKLKAQLNNSAETIHVGDTLKFRLTIPDTIITSLNERIAVTTMRSSFYAFHLARVDTATKIYTTIWDNAVVTDGGTLQSGGAVYLSTSTKPFRATLNIIPRIKGLYNLQIDPQPGFLRINESYACGLLVNFDVADKHWGLFDPYYPGSSTAAANSNTAGYGCYYFRVN